MPNKLSIEDFKDKELNPNSSPFEVLAFVAQVALQKLKHKENNTNNADSSQRKKRSRKREGATMIKHNSREKPNHLAIPTEEWLKTFADKKKQDTGGSNDVMPPPLLPEEFEQKIMKKCGGTRPNPIIHIFQKKLFATDVSTQQCRLSICCNKIESFEFLREEEMTHLRHEKDGIKVALIHKPIREKKVKETRLTLKQWDLHKNHKDPQKISHQYVLNGGWNKIVSQDNLQVGHTVDVWAFRDIEDKLCMAIVKQES